MSDGRYTAKNEVFINILGSHESNGFPGIGSRPPPSISNVVQNISKFLPSFDQLPGVQNIRNGLPNRRPGINLPQRFPANNGGNYALPSYANYFPPPSLPDVSQAAEEGDNAIDLSPLPTSSSPSPEGSPDSTSTTPRTRTKLTPITNHTSARPVESQSESKTHPQHDADNGTITLFSIKSSSIPIIAGVCGTLAVLAALFGYLCRRRLCAISKTLKKSKEKEELAKKSNSSHLSNTLTDDSRNSMVMQQWNGPVAFSNRYVPWEREQQLAITVSHAEDRNEYIYTAALTRFIESSSICIAQCAISRASGCDRRLSTSNPFHSWIRMIPLTFSANCQSHLSTIVFISSNMNTCQASGVNHLLFQRALDDQLSQCDTSITASNRYRWR